jgi:ubiquinone/menaquinone biosynthesis C-methylase UbiE
MLGPEYDQIARAIPNDHARPSGSREMLEYAAGKAGRRPGRVLDFGCGIGDQVETIQGVCPGAAYVGVDIEASPEVSARERSDAEFHSFDGINLPFPDESFDIVFSKQVFEHVRHPDAAIRDIERVLKPGGWFVGSLSNLEPYHSFSIFNYTPYGVFRVTEDNGLTLEVMRPGPEGLGMIIRQMTLRRINHARLAYPLIRAAARLRGWEARKANYLMLRLSGHICFAARKPDGEGGA